MANLELILKQANSFDQILAGLCPLEGLLSSPSYQSYRPLGWGGDEQSGIMVEPEFPSQAKSVLVLALSHPLDRPDLDWWEKGNTKGNRRLMNAADELRDRLAAGPGLRAEPLPYYPEKGGLFLKEAAALAGLGVIGRNNLLITPQYGARVRIRVLMLEEEVPAPDPPKDFDPCADCPAPCMDACPQGALSKEGYSRRHCLRRMNSDREAAGADGPGVPPEPVKYCRLCEHACLANRK